MSVYSHNHCVSYNDLDTITIILFLQLSIPYLYIYIQYTIYNIQYTIYYILYTIYYILYIVIYNHNHMIHISHSRFLADSPRVTEVPDRAAPWRRISRVNWPMAWSKSPRCTGPWSRITWRVEGMAKPLGISQ